MLSKSLSTMAKGFVTVPGTEFRRLFMAEEKSFSNEWWDGNESVNESINESVNESVHFTIPKWWAKCKNIRDQ